MGIFTSLFSSAKKPVYSHTVDHRPFGGIVKVVDADDIVLTPSPDKYFYPHHGYTEFDYDTYCISCTNKNNIVIYDNCINAIYNTAEDKYYINDGRHRVRSAQKLHLQVQIRIIETHVYE